MSLFLYRLVPPRADFAQTLTVEEQAVMAEHGDYWNRLLAEGRAVVFGPVADPEGIWGMGVVRGDSHEEVVLLAQNDPAIMSGIATFDVFEILGGRTG